jgi:quercetin dioxygenase-like cupin family protein
MTNAPDRQRDHPEHRFSAAQHHYDLSAVARTLNSEASSGHGHRQETLYKGSDLNKGPTTVALFTFDKGAHFPRHVAQGVVTMHVVHGHMRVLSNGQTFQLKTNHVLVLRPGVAHELFAEMDSQMLLTVCLEPAAQN